MTYVVARGILLLPGLRLARVVRRRVGASGRVVAARLGVLGRLRVEGVAVLVVLAGIRTDGRRGEGAGAAGKVEGPGGAERRSAGQQSVNGHGDFWRFREDERGCGVWESFEVFGEV